MNVYDSERIIRLLKPEGFIRTDFPEKADLIILNTCAIREKAEQKAFSFLGRLSKLKKKNPELLVGVGGCVAQQEAEKALSRVPSIDFVFGTHAVPRIAEIINRVEVEGRRIVDVKMSDEINESGRGVDDTENSTVSRFVTIMRGCDNFCTYCVVPHVRGSEASRKPDSIVNEVKALVDAGVREVTLLGQNVNSYGTKEGLCSFPELLSRVNDVTGIGRVRFTTSHPKDMSDELIDSFQNLDKLCNHIHLPVQSGSDRVLKKMNRKYTRDQYLDKIMRLKKVCPDIAITSDFIVGFPGEMEDDFQETIKLIETVGYDGLFAFKYSDRPSAPARSFSGKVPEDIKKKRLKVLLELQESITAEKNKMLVGQTVQVLVEGFSKKQGNETLTDKLGKTQWSGRTVAHKIVNFYGSDENENLPEISIGQLVDVRIEKALAHSLWGICTHIDHDTRDEKGDKHYAA